LASTPTSTKRNGKKNRINDSEMIKRIKQKMSKKKKKTRLCRKIQHGVSFWYRCQDPVWKCASVSDPF